MQRLVYSPKVFAYVRTQGFSQPLDLSSYIVSGEVQRKVNQVSNASLTLRNSNFRFTKQGASGTALFHPMDPITIYLQRLSGKPVQVFTGYLDTTPYIELFPGTITLQASCTLKRLLYTFFDPALPYMNGFMSQYGWTVDRGGGQIFNITAEQTKFRDSGDLTDGSIGNLLFATLKHIGHWSPDNIFIEKLPAGIAKKVTKIYDSLNQVNKEAEQEFEHLMTKLIGPGQFGTSPMGGDASTGDVKGAANIIPVVVSIAERYGIPPAFVVSVLMQETTLTGKDGNISAGGGLGWFQWNNPNPYHYGSANKTVPDWQNKAHDLGYATDLFCQCAVATLHLDGSYERESNWQAWAQKTQTSNYNDGRWPGNVASGKALVAKYGTATADPAHPNRPNSTPGHKRRIRANPPSGGGSGTSPNDVTSMAPGISTSAVPTSGGGAYGAPRSYGSHAGVDISMPEGTALVACVSGTIAAENHNWYASSNGKGEGLITIKSDAPHNGYPAGTYFGYGHSDVHYVKVGDHVKPGQKIGLSGNPGGGPHLHFFISVSGHAKYGPGGNGNVDPTAFAKAALGGKSVPTFDGGSGTTTTTDGNSTGDQLVFSKATAFATFLDFPSIEETAEATMLKGAKSLMNDKPLFPFIEQLSKASLRQFQSAPNGDFFAFFADYFGSFGRQPYWHIDDLEILDGRIQLSDDSLATHVYVVGDTIPGGGVTLPEKLASGGVVNVFNAFQDNWIEKDKDSPLKDKKAAIEFLQRYGARPVYLEEAFIRSPYFEAFYAYIEFLRMWSSQFLTPFQVTFMPELYPGGLVAFDSHNLQCYIEDVTHTFDYEGGFTTQVNLSSPAAIHNDGGDPSTGMVLASTTSLASGDSTHSHSTKKSTKGRK